MDDFNVGAIAPSLWPSPQQPPEEDNNQKWYKSPHRRCKCGTRPDCPDCWRLFGARTDRESDAIYKELVSRHAPRIETPDDKPLPEKFLLRLGHEFARDPEFWQPILLRVLSHGRAKG